MYGYLTDKLNEGYYGERRSSASSDKRTEYKYVLLASIYYNLYCVCTVYIPCIRYVLQLIEITRTVSTIICTVYYGTRPLH